MRECRRVYKEPRNSLAFDLVFSDDEECGARFLQDNEMHDDLNGKALQLTFGVLMVRSLALVYRVDADLFHVM